MRDHCVGSIRLPLPSKDPCSVKCSGDGRLLICTQKSAHTLDLKPHIAFGSDSNRSRSEHVMDWSRPVLPVRWVVKDCYAMYGADWSLPGLSAAGQCLLATVVVTRPYSHSFTTLEIYEDTPFDMAASCTKLVALSVEELFTDVTKAEWEAPECFESVLSCPPSSLAWHPSISSDKDTPSSLLAVGGACWVGLFRAGRDRVTPLSILCTARDENGRRSHAILEMKWIDSCTLYAGTSSGSVDMYRLVDNSLVFEKQVLVGSGSPVACMCVFKKYDGTWSVVVGDRVGNICFEASRDHMGLVEVEPQTAIVGVTKGFDGFVWVLSSSGKFCKIQVNDHSVSEHIPLRKNRSAKCFALIGSPNNTHAIALWTNVPTDESTMGLNVDFIPHSLGGKCDLVAGIHHNLNRNCICPWDLSMFVGQNIDAEKIDEFFSNDDEAVPPGTIVATANYCLKDDKTNWRNDLCEMLKGTVDSAANIAEKARRKSKKRKEKDESCIVCGDILVDSGNALVAKCEKGHLMRRCGVTREIVDSAQVRECAFCDVAVSYDEGKECWRSNNCPLCGSILSMHVFEGPSSTSINDETGDVQIISDSRIPRTTQLEM